jgi:hypothetical protein
VNYTTSALFTAPKGIFLTITPSNSSAITTPVHLRYSEQLGWCKYNTREFRPDHDPWSSDNPAHYLPQELCEAVHTICSLYDCSCYITTVTYPPDMLSLRSYTLFFEGVQASEFGQLHTRAKDMLNPE